MSAKPPRFELPVSRAVLSGLQAMETRLRWVQMRPSIEAAVRGALQGELSEGLRVIWPGEGHESASVGAWRGLLRSISDHQPKLAREVERVLARRIDSSAFAAPLSDFEDACEDHWRDKMDLLYVTQPTAREQERAADALRAVQAILQNVWVLSRSRVYETAATARIMDAMSRLDALAERDLRQPLHRDVILEHEATFLEWVFDALEQQRERWRNHVIDVVDGKGSLKKLFGFGPTPRARLQVWRDDPELRALLPAIWNGSLHGMLKALASYYRALGEDECAIGIEVASAEVVEHAQALRAGELDEEGFIHIGQTLGKVAMQLRAPDGSPTQHSVFLHDIAAALAQPAFVPGGRD